MTPADYAQYCGPGAYAAVVGCSREHAAGALCRWAKRAGWPPSVSTSPTVLAGALLARGIRLERWAVLPHGWRVQDVDAFTREVFACLPHEGEAIEDAAAAIAGYRQFRESQSAHIRRVLDAADRTRAERRELRRIRTLTLIEWLRRRPRGLWVLHVEGHVLVASAGALIAGDDQGRYDVAPLRDAWRVLRAS